ncbi:MAG: ATP-binding cassette domain-containing protein [Phycisphaerae bacterium]|nr:ATP-binding cassette domain-containing protein [Phycisphaerae bacterium]MDD5380910.1 ATP-binding cassette domain-containing protein [Phycisphaerae bacterium]
MAIIGMQDVSVGFGGRPLLEHINLQIQAGERICLLGRNGVGKTTLMKLITGEVLPEKGDVSRVPQLTVTCLTQDVPDNLNGTVFEFVSEGLGECGKLLAQYHFVSHQLALDHDNKSLLTKLDKLQHSLDTENGWQMDRYVENIIEHMELDAETQAASLSAGMKRRVLLAQALVRNPDVLLLDEPTNHIDIEAVTWIEDFLAGYKGTLIFVSHDRVFVRKLAKRIIELDRGRAVSYFCDYETFLVRRDNANEAQAAEDALFDKKLAQEEVWIRKGIKARRTRSKSRVRALKKMRNERSLRRKKIGNARMQLQDVQQSGRLVIEAKDISFAYLAEKPIISKFSATIMRGDKIGVVGPNSSGKTTLLRVLLKELSVQQGTVRHGTNLEIAYFDQLHAQLEYEKSVYENIADGNERVVVNGRPRHVIGYLQDFLFTPDQSRSPLSNLSGGERNRLLLAKLFTRPANVLVLDEPTNDLDIETLDLLEELLLEYPGTVLMVSHDRQFLNNVVTSIMAMEGNGVINEYVGGYDDWLRQKKALPKPEPQQSPAKGVKAVPPKEQVRKLTFKEKKELKGLPALIEKLESEQRQLYEVMADPAFYKKGSEVVAASTRAGELKKQLDEVYARWQELEALQ